MAKNHTLRVDYIIIMFISLMYIASGGGGGILPQRKSIYIATEVRVSGEMYIA